MKSVTKISIITVGTVFLALGSSVCSAANAASLNIPTTVVQGTDVFSGPSFTVNGNYSPTDTISVNVSGTVDLASGNFTANAAGIIVAPAITNTGGQPGQVTISAGKPYAALLIGNTSLGFFPLFPANAANGLGNSTPPTNLSLNNASLASIFGPSFSGLTNGTVLEFRINDINTFDNSGAFTIRNAATVTSVPEPSEVAATLIFGALGAVYMLKSHIQKEKQLNLTKI